MNKFDDNVAKIMRQGMPEEEQVHIATHIESTHLWANQNLQAMRGWAVDLQILMGQPISKVDLRDFYIGLYGIIGDMHRHFTDKVAFQKKLLKKKKIEDLKVTTERCGDARLKQYLLGQIKAYEIINEIHSIFTSVERRQIQFFRHRYCHPILTGFAVKIEIDEDTGKRYFDNTKKYNDFIEISKSKAIDHFENLYTKLQSQVGNLQKLEKTILGLQTS